MNIATSGLSKPYCYPASGVTAVSLRAATKTAENGMIANETRRGARPAAQRRSLVALATVLSLFFVDISYAQEEEIEEIVVTGSRIPRTGFETLQPATVLDGEQLSLRGNVDISQALNEQAGFAVPAISAMDIANGDDLGQSYVDYLGLGQQRTLTLVNGLRFPAGVSPTSTGGLSVDLNSIPENLVERIETIAIGGAPIYGSDAIAGTINIILRDDFEGFEVFGQSGTSPEFGDAGRFNFGATWGANFDNDRGNIVLSAQYRQVDGLKKTDRPASATGIGFESPGDPESIYDLELFDDTTVAVDNLTPFPLFGGNRGGSGFLIFGNGIPLDINDPNSPVTQFDREGNLLPFVPGGGTGSVIFQNGGDGLKLASLSSLYQDSERGNFNVFLNYDLTDNLRFKAETWYSKNRSTEIINQPTFNSPAFGGLPNDGFGDVNSGPIPVFIDNPFLPDATRQTITEAINVVHDMDGDGLADPTIDIDGDGVPDRVGFWRGGPLIGLVGDNPSSTERETVRGVLGLEGDLVLGSRNFLWDAAFTYGRVEAYNRSLQIVQSNFEQAIQVIVDDNGEAACLDPSGGCIPLNVIGPNTPEAINFSSQFVEDKVVTEQRVLQANIGGDVFDLPAGPIGIAGGFAYREESAVFDPNDIQEKGFGRTTLVPISGEFDTTEFYVETVVPLLGGDLGTPFVERLEFEGAVRFVDNSVAGEDTTWTAGLRFGPIDDIEIRGNFTESIRAPSITELFTPASTVFAFANDPCDERFINQGNVPETRAANCAADGIVQPFQSLIVNASQQVTLSGNTNLDSEVAESVTYGVVLRPRFIDGLTASFDWFDIEIANAVETATTTDILRACYDSSSFATEPSCQLFTRDATGQISGAQTGFQNVGLVEISALQSAISYGMSLGNFGDLNLTLTHLYTEQHLETPGSGNTVRLDGQVGRSKDRVNLNAIWSLNDWTVFAQARYLSGVVFDNSDDFDASDGSATRNVPGLPSWTVFDASVAYALNDHIDLQLNIDNLFDRAAPFASIASGNGESTYFSGILERYAMLTVRARF